MTLHVPRCLKGCSVPGHHPSPGPYGRGCACETPRSRPRLVCTSQCTARVYIAATHLEGLERVDSFLKMIGRGVQDVIALHTMTIVEEAVEEDTSLKVCDGTFSGLLMPRAASTEHLQSSRFYGIALTEPHKYYKHPSMPSAWCRLTHSLTSCH